MPKFESIDLSVKFELPDEPNALEIIAYDSRRMEFYDQPAIVILWECVKPLIRNWECEALPDCLVDLRTVTSYQAAQAVEYAAFRGSEWRISLDSVPKNS